ncbi:MAG: 3-dehydroquinate synthase [Bacteroidia bacterium]|nr:3-dehydroquinate synthase [Bacteroidia bacterium]
MSASRLIFSENLHNDLNNLLANYATDQVFVLTDTNSEKYCLPQLRDVEGFQAARFLTIPAGDEHKNVENLSAVWQFLSNNGATRKSVLVNLGGGMVTDLGGFAAASFKRGIDCIHLPTTVLSAVDAAVGGKTGINFNGLKNEIGAFHLPVAVVFHAPFFGSLDHANILSGYAEMLKHGLLSDVKYWNELLALDLEHPESPEFLKAVKRSVEIKDEITTKDPKEQGLRKALNLGHTVGHAFESLSHQEGKPVLHGYAVAWGLLCELYLSMRQLDFPVGLLQSYIHFVRQEYGVYPISCKDYPALYEAMTHDKKNEGYTINFTLLSGIGELKLDQTANRQQIEEMFDFYCDALGI